jgi:NAD(P)-dependent dehydrogenase (short-subunit alcohol dehydrogenase family)
MKISKRQLRRIIIAEKARLLKEQWTPADAGAAAAAAEARGPDFGYLQNLWNNAAHALEEARATAERYGLDPDYAELMADMNDLVDSAFEISKALRDEADKQ